MTGLTTFLRFEVLRLLRNVRYVGITVGFPVVFYLLFLNDEHPAAQIAGTTWRTYFMVSMASFGAMVAALNASGTRLAAERASGWTRQLRVTPLPAWSYVSTKIAAAMVIVLPVIVLVELTGFLFGGVRLGTGVWISLAAVLWVSSLPFASLGVLVGFVASSETAYPLVTALMFLLSFFGGLFNPVRSLPVVLRHVAVFLPTYHHAALGWAVVAGRPPDLVDVGVLLAYAVVLGLAVTWRHRVEEARALA
ncbi:MAG TPA: ABC transporter permease [Acidimicrobiales bacterium]|nr:ABC transporter permease [Acidimicrobiales bacterium]